MKNWAKEIILLIVSGIMIWVGYILFQNVAHAHYDGIEALFIIEIILTFIFAIVLLR